MTNLLEKMIFLLGILMLPLLTLTLSDKYLEHMLLKFEQIVWYEIYKILRVSLFIFLVSWQKRLTIFEKGLTSF